MYQGPGVNTANKNLCTNVALVSGTTADTDITVNGIKYNKDALLAVIGLDPDNATADDQVKDFTASASVTADNTIQVSTDTSDYKLLVFWQKV